MQIFTGSSGRSLVQKLPEFTRGERSSRRGYFYLQQIVRLRITDGMRSWAHLDAGMQDSARRRCRGWGNPNQMEWAEDHCRNNIHSGLRKPHGCNEKVLHKRRGLSQSCVLQYVGTRTLDYWEQPALDAGCYVQRGCIKGTQGLCCRRSLLLENSLCRL